MSDFLVDLSENQAAQSVLKALGLQLPLPQKLERATGPWLERPLADEPVVVRAGGVSDALAAALAKTGANPFVVGDELAPWRAAGEAWGRPAVSVAMDEVPEGLRPRALIFDGTNLAGPGELEALHRFMKPRLRSLVRCGRVIVLGRPPAEPAGYGRAAAAHALEGFVRSLAKELGRRGATAQLIQVASGAEARLEPLLRFLLTPRAAFVSGQVLEVTATVRASEDPPLVRALDGKVALVTGAARGIGAATAAALAREGAKVICLDRPDDDGPASEVASRVGGQVLLADLSEPSAGDTIAEHVKSTFGHLDVLVHNAGITRDRTLAKMSEAEWAQAMRVNLQAVIDVTEALDPLLADHARIVGLSSVAGIAGNFGQTNYAASKSGLIGFIQKLAPAVADRGIAVNAVAPGFIETRLTRAIPAVTREAGRRLSNLSQGGLPEDVAEVITFLSSPGAAGLTGQVWRVCGGSLIGA